MNIMTHNGTLTVRNSSTGNHRTFKIHTQKEDAKFAPGMRVVSLLTGPDNENDYQGFGFLLNDGTIALWRRMSTSGTYRAYVKVLCQVDWCEENWGMEYMWEDAKCRVCNRKLTTPESMESGIGPICAKRTEFA